MFSSFWSWRPLQTGSPGGTGPDLTAIFESDGTVTLTTGTETATFGLEDTTEPYQYSAAAGDGAALAAYITAINGLSDRATTILLDDNQATPPSFTVKAGDAQAWIQNTAITPITVPEADGDPTPTYAVEGTSPAGISFNTATRVISGTPTTVSSGTITIRATNSAGTADWTVDFTTTAELALPTVADQDGFVGVPLNIQLPVATGGDGSYSYTATPRPAGLSFASGTRRITGNPTTVQTVTVTYTVTDGNNASVSRDFDFSITQPLLLADWDDSGLQVVGAALLAASAPGTAGNNLYADSDRGGTDTPLDGELGLGGTDTVVSRIRRANATVLVLNDNNNPAVLDIGDYFDTGGDGNDLTVYIQTAADGVVSFAAADQLSGNRNAQVVRFTLPSDAQSLLDNIATGDRWIIAFARPLPMHTVNAGDVSWSFSVPQPTISYTPPPMHSIDAGDVAWVFDVPEPTVSYTPPPVHTVDAGDVGWSFAVPQPTVTYTPPPMHTVGAGDVAWSFSIPQPTITYMPPSMDLVDAGDVDWSFTVTEPTVTYTPPPLDHTVNAGDVSWTFHVSQPTVTHIPLVPIDHRIDAGDVAWSFDVPEPAVTYTPPPMHQGGCWRHRLVLHDS